MTRQEHRPLGKPAQTTGGWKASLASKPPCQARRQADGGWARTRIVSFHLAKHSLDLPHLRRVDRKGRHGSRHRALPGIGGAVRTSIASQDRSWSARGIDVTAKINEIRQKDPRVSLQVELQAAFGLRAREAMQLRPHFADKGSYLSITHGTKGGRDRVEPIRTPEQRALLERAKTFCASHSSSTSDPKRKLHQWKNHYYQVVRAFGITRKDEIVSHGLRHQYANDRYQELTGTDSPVRGGDSVEKSTDKAARSVVAEELGHSREGVTTHYLGRREPGGGPIAWVGAPHNDCRPGHSTQTVGPG